MIATKHDIPTFWFEFGQSHCPPAQLFRGVSYP